MIGEAIQAALVEIIPNTFSEVAMDENAAAPFCLHTESETPVVLKEGNCGYTYKVEVFIADHTPDLVKSLSVSVITALEGLTGTTYPDHEDLEEGEVATIIDEVIYEGDEPGFDPESRLHGNSLTFTIETLNR
jgi:hypothetical protein